MTQHMPVSMQELYDHMKAVLKLFDLHFSEMDKVHVGIHVGANKAELVFSYGNQSTSINIIK